MNTVAKLTQKQIEKLAVEIRTFLLEHDMWVDTQIYFNGKCFDTHDKETGEFYYNDPEHLVVRENEDPRRYTKAETIRRWRRDLKKKARSRRRKEIYKAMQNCREE